MGQPSSGTIRLSGRFDFSCYKQFSAQYEGLLSDASIQSIDVNFANVEYIDSSALGMLLLLRDKATSVGKSIRITQAQGMVADIMKVANLQKKIPFA